jgi:hypothetical protein
MGKANETAPVHHAYRRCGGRGIAAAAGRGSSTARITARRQRLAATVTKFVLAGRIPTSDERNGYVEGKNFTLDYIDLQGRVDRYSAAMPQLVDRKADVLVAFGPEEALKAALAATQTIPIVMVAIDYDPFALRDKPCPADWQRHRHCP